MHLDGLVDQVQALLIRGNGRGEAALVAHIRRVLPILLLDDRLEVVVHLYTAATGTSRWCCDGRLDVHYNILLVNSWHVRGVQVQPPKMHAGARAATLALYAKSAAVRALNREGGIHGTGAK